MPSYSVQYYVVGYGMYTSHSLAKVVQSFWYYYTLFNNILVQPKWCCCKMNSLLQNLLHLIYHAKAIIVAWTPTYHACTVTQPKNQQDTKDMH